MKKMELNGFKQIDINELNSISGGSSNKIRYKVGYAIGFVTSGTMRRAIRKGSSSKYHKYY